MRHIPRGYGLRAGIALARLGRPMSLLNRDRLCHSANDRSRDCDDWRQADSLAFASCDLADLIEATVGIVLHVEHESVHGKSHRNGGSHGNFQ